MSYHRLYFGVIFGTQGMSHISDVSYRMIWVISYLPALLRDR